MARVDVGEDNGKHLRLAIRKPVNLGLVDLGWGLLGRDAWV
jgi:hypothetical protein